LQTALHQCWWLSSVDTRWRRQSAPSSCSPVCVFSISWASVRQVHMFACLCLLTYLHSYQCVCVRAYLHVYIYNRIFSTSYCFIYDTWYIWISYNTNIIGVHLHMYLHIFNRVFSKYHTIVLLFYQILFDLFDFSIYFHFSFSFNYLIKYYLFYFQFFVHFFHFSFLFFTMLSNNIWFLSFLFKSINTCDMIRCNIAYL
jgi:hypothetical protein